MLISPTQHSSKISCIVLSLTVFRTLNGYAKRAAKLNLMLLISVLPYVFRFRISYEWRIFGIFSWITLEILRICTSELAEFQFHISYSLYVCMRI